MIEVNTSACWSLVSVGAGTLLLSAFCFLLSASICCVFLLKFGKFGVISFIVNKSESYVL